MGLIIIYSIPMKEHKKWIITIPTWWKETNYSSQNFGTKNNLRWDDTIQSTKSGFGRNEKNIFAKYESEKYC